MSQSLTRKIAVSAAWTYFSYSLSKSAAFITTAVLARLLTQAQFGIVGFALTTMSFLDAVREIGLGVALIRRQDHVDEAADTVFWSTLVSNIGIWLLLCLLSPLVADFFHEPQIVMILPVISFTFVLSGLGSTHDALLQRELEFRKRTLPTLGSSIVKGVISVGLAAFGFGVWALVFGQLASRAAFTFLAWRAVDWRPRFRFDMNVLREMLGYGSRISLDNFLSALQANIDYVFIGRFLGDAALGLYTVAFRVPELIIINFATMIAHVLYPAYSKMQRDIEQLQNGLLQTLRYVSIVTVPMGVGLALISPQFVEVVFGARWLDAAPIMAMLALYGTVLTVSWNIGDIYKAIGRADILWKTAMLELAVLVPVLYLMAQQSAFAVALGQVCVALIVSTLRLVIAMWLLKIPVRKTLAQFVPSFSAGLVMAAALLLSANAMRTWLALVTLLSMVIIGAVTYSVVLFWFERNLFRRLARAARKQRFSHTPESAVDTAPVAD